MTDLVQEFKPPYLQSSPPRVSEVQEPELSPKEDQSPLK